MAEANSPREADDRAASDRHELPPGVSEHEIEDIEDRARLRTPVIYEIVRREGETEMERPITSLWWSGVAAGLSISFSLLAQAALLLHLPDVPWRPLVSSFGYSVGFLIVVLARQQLFTENTVTVVLPVMAELTAANVRRLARMWSVVFAANMTGTFVAALFCTVTPVLAPDLRAAMLELSRAGMALGWVEMLFRAVGAGFLIAAMVWLIPSAEGAQFQVITMVTYLIALAGFAHIVAGSVEGFMLVLNGGLTIWDMIGRFIVPVLLGNIIGGTALFAVISYAQVMKEM
ncbi:MAG TPA: formate/nitrite transporter family protein [Stellaceae bacterium]|jgi:formate/nitrite transporter FocA (FNT family)|nr:formate/nitrite transporter family protein [Stellaceae bacterium]